MKQPIRVLALPLYPEQFSSRIRMGYFADPLRARGIEILLAPPIPMGSFLEFYQGDRNKRIYYHLLEWRNRVQQIWQAQSYDILWVQKGLALFPWRGLNLWKGLFANRVVIDIDDDILTQPPIEIRSWRCALGDPHQMRKAVISADWVLAGNPALGKSLQELNPQTVVFPSTIPLSKIPRPTDSTIDPRPTIVWIGTASNRPYLNLVAEGLASLAERLPGLRLRIISDDLSGIEIERFKRCLIELKKWKAEDEYESLRPGTVGILPLDQSDWAKKKGGYKILQYFAMGQPCVASDVGANRDLIQHGVNGYLANSPSEWEESLYSLLTDRDKSAAFGKNGRALVEREFSTEKRADQLETLFRKLGGRERLC